MVRLLTAQVQTLPHAGAERRAYVFLARAGYRLLPACAGEAGKRIATPACALARNDKEDGTMIIEYQGERFSFRECDVKGITVEELTVLAKSGHIQYEPRAAWLVIPAVGYGLRLD